MLKVYHHQLKSGIGSEDIPEAWGDVLGIAACAEGIFARGWSASLSTCDVVRGPEASICVNLGLEDLELLREITDCQDMIDEGPGVEVLVIEFLQCFAIRADAPHAFLTHPDLSKA